MIIYFNNELQYIDLRLLSSLPLTPDLAWWRVQFIWGCVWVGNEQFTIFMDDNQNFKKGEVRFNFTQIFIELVGPL